MAFDIASAQVLAQPVSGFMQGRALRLAEQSRAAAETRAQEEHDVGMQEAKTRLGAVKAKQVYAGMQQVLAVPEGRRKQFIEENFPDLAKQMSGNGHDWASFDERAVTSMAEGIAAHAAAELGVTPAKPEEFTLSPGQTRFAGGKPVATVAAEDKPTSDQQNYELAQKQGYKGTFQKWLLDMRRAGATSINLGAQGLSSPPTGYARPDPLKPGLIIEPGGPADPANKPKPLPSEADKKNAVLFSSMVNAEKQIQGLAEKPGATDTSSWWNSTLGASAITKLMQSDEYRQYEAAGLRWAANLLYLKSGATANPDEIRSTWKQFFPQPGEGKGVKSQKEQARQQEIAAIRKSMVPGASQGPSPGDVEQGYRFKGGNPADPHSWEPAK